MPIDLLVVWGVAQAAGFLFKPVLEDLAKDAGKDVVKGYVENGEKSSSTRMTSTPRLRSTRRCWSASSVRQPFSISCTSASARTANKGS